MLEQAAARANGGLRVLAIASAEGEDDVRAFIQALQLPDVSALLDPTGAVRDQYLILGYPTTFFLDRGGIIREKKVGTYDAATLVAILQNLGVNP